VRGRAQTGGGNSGSVPRVGADGLQEEVQRAKAAGRQKIAGSRGRLDAITKGAQGASAEAADDVKEW
jgi:conjugal transfer mating pair stabilization protein TraG